MTKDLLCNTDLRIRQLEIVYSTAQVVLGHQVRCGGSKWYMD